jgi:hypothetical protein
MKITVNDFKNKVLYTMEVDKEWSVEQMKIMLEIDHSLGPVAQQVLCALGKTLENDRVLGELGFDLEKTVFVFLRRQVKAELPTPTPTPTSTVATPSPPTTAPPAEVKFAAPTPTPTESTSVSAPVPSSAPVPMAEPTSVPISVESMPAPTATAPAPVPAPTLTLDSIPVDPMTEVVKVKASVKAKVESAEMKDDENLVSLMALGFDLRWSTAAYGAAFKDVQRASNYLFDGRSLASLEEMARANAPPRAPVATPAPAPVAEPVYMEDLGTDGSISMPMESELAGQLGPDAIAQIRVAYHDWVQGSVENQELHQTNPMASLQRFRDQFLSGGTGSDADADLGDDQSQDWRQ